MHDPLRSPSNVSEDPADALVVDDIRDRWRVRFRTATARDVAPVCPKAPDVTPSFFRFRADMLRQAPHAPRYLDRSDELHDALQNLEFTTRQRDDALKLNTDARAAAATAADEQKQAENKVRDLEAELATLKGQLTDVSKQRDDAERRVSEALNGTQRSRFNQRSARLSFCGPSTSLAGSFAGLGGSLATDGKYTPQPSTAGRVTPTRSANASPRSLRSPGPQGTAAANSADANGGVTRGSARPTTAAGASAQAPAPAARSASGQRRATTPARTAGAAGPAKGTAPSPTRRATSPAVTPNRRWM